MNAMHALETTVKPVNMLLTESGFNCSYDLALEEISCVGYDSMLATKWLYLGRGSTAKLAWLLFYALDSYNYGATDNYITEEQVSAIFSKTNLL